MTVAALPSFQWVYCWSKGCTHKLFMVAPGATGTLSIKCRCGSVNLIDLTVIALR